MAAVPASGDKRRLVGQRLGVLLAAAVVVFGLLGAFGFELIHSQGDSRRQAERSFQAEARITSELTVVAVRLDGVQCDQSGREIFRGRAHLGRVAGEACAAVAPSVRVDRGWPRRCACRVPGHAGGRAAACERAAGQTEPEAVDAELAVEPLAVPSDERRRVGASLPDRARAARAGRGDRREGLDRFPRRLPQGPGRERETRRLHRRR